MLVLIGAELYDLFFFLFGLQPGTATPVQMALDYIAGATLTIVFATMNFLRFRQIGGSTWPRTTKFLAVCTFLLAVYWISVMCYGFWNIVSFGEYGDTYITSQLWGSGYLVDATLNAALSAAFLVHLRVMSRGNSFRTGLQRYVTKAQALLVLESASIISVLAVQLVDLAIDPLWLLFYLAQSVRSAAYCMLLQLLTRIMSQRNKAPVGHSTSFTISELSGSTNAVMSVTQARSDGRAAPAMPPRRTGSSLVAGGGSKTGQETFETRTAPPLARSAVMTLE
ncbi:hypothetical protein AMAG_20024 [Allomyces macrogynus ATCC 38327]|uniref:Uncharacterized protein n=1 Tax=Allomyces macrogynus (strain ATCC 38327) TaxID=578462 RepID=A0A0L0T4N8_ALLM3|nr:hypothetical protein AMAG_20024 [Allomyces macrogynus ATCC 38327]|eukprot:KNE69702.1 hypothetical protein AMAG_20024 [Allomyces macrogynus ATCC 38327]